MASFVHQVIRSVFGASEHVAPKLGGRLAFELFCRTANPNKLSPGERKAITQAKPLMEEGRRHCLPVTSGTVMAFDFRPLPGIERRGKVLVVHGWRSRTEHMRFLIKGLCDAGFHVTALDLPGHGHSSGRKLNLVLAVEAVRATADWLGPFDAIVGHSFGGAVAINAVVGSVAGIAPVVTERLVTIASPNSMPALFDDTGRLLNLGPRAQHAMNARVEHLAGRPLEQFVCSEQLKKMPIPTLVIHAPDDREVAAGSAEALSTAGPHVRVHWTPGLGHRRILADADVVAETVSFVGAENRSLAA
ncbi:alpha/beta fold hydrolase [Mesorhizobium sp. NBSH29]|uniref:alpha/beta fold hydrolase n=1 Tax=Mesorhizobium sp. NBSH29 TaxID=2654249 RepID=UPI001896665C|nr:alpha/beta fold hydrolase [Mesorhizobium sp. NBSH29]QPC87987.1 alpha/beta fold hydrolase [Mesorhizobium sp. NBSH29]